MLDRPIHRDQSEWTEARIEELTRRWLAGESGAQIASALGGTTRNAVIGKVHRLKLLGMQQPKAPPTPKRSKPQAVRAKFSALVQGVAMTSSIKPPRLLPEPTGLPEISARRRLIDLRANECRFCDGDPLTADHSFCGAPVQAGSSWCPVHHRIVFTRSL